MVLNLLQDYKQLQESLFSIYSGELFGSKDYLWVQLHRHYYQKQFDTICEMFIALYEKKNDSKAIENIMHKKEMIHQ